MRGDQGLSKLNRAELRLYGLLGVKAFRKLIMLIEKLRHFGDGGKNANYHLRCTSAAAMRSFPGYLIYNTSFHAASLLLCAVYFLLTGILRYRRPALDALTCVLVVINLYCIMLQRYNCLRLKAALAAKEASASLREAELIRRVLPALENKTPGELAEERGLLERIRFCFENGGELIFDEGDAEPLNRLADAVGAGAGRRCAKGAFPGGDEPMAEVLSGLATKPFVVNRVERRVSRLQKRIGARAADNVSFGYALIAPTGECEKAFRRLIPRDSRESAELTVNALAKAYGQAAGE